MTHRPSPSVFARASLAPLRSTPLLAAAVAIVVACAVWWLSVRARRHADVIAAAATVEPAQPRVAVSATTPQTAADDPVTLPATVRTFEHQEPFVVRIAARRPRPAARF
jgi:hypothetical protein